MLLFKILLCMVLVLSLIGCATTRRETTTIKTQQLEMRIGQLEKELQQKDRKIYELEGKMGLVRSESSKIIKTEIYPEKKTVTGKKEMVFSQATPKKIQLALKKAGFYNGAVDGKIGKNTNGAIKEFQKKNGLKSDGVVGKKTWAELSKYLD